MEKDCKGQNKSKEREGYHNGSKLASSQSRRVGYGWVFWSGLSELW